MPRRSRRTGRDCRRCAWRPPAVAPASLRTKRRTSSRNQPFSSAQRPQEGNLPSCDRPAASHASAISFVPASTGCSAMCWISGGSSSTLPFGAAAQDRRQVEAEAVDVQLGDQVGQAVDDQVAHQRMIAVERVAAAGEVVIAAFPVEHVVDGVVQAAEAERRAVLVALAGVVVDHVEDDLDAGLVEGLDHLLELAHLLAGLGGVGRLGREEGERRVAPVVPQRSPVSGFLRACSSSSNSSTGISWTAVTPSDFR